ncbi:MAG: hypothetical protein KAQ69_04785 [Spirochaetales bacterium]|nr:hypothetical protein [Spirochaetales bacterium]
MNIDIEKYNKKISYAITYFWHTRERQLGDQRNRNTSDQGNRGAVTGGKQLDGFIELLTDIAQDYGIDDEYIHTKSNYLPGYFRPSKDWDFLITTPQGNLVCAIELKSQVGSFGNNFNNRTEESLGSSLDLATSLSENSFPFSIMPWIGYLVVIENSEKSSNPVKVQERLYKVRSEFRNSSYIQRYDIFCQRLMAKKLYNSASIIWTKPDLSFGHCSIGSSIKTFLKSFISNLLVRADEFK